VIRYILAALLIGGVAGYLNNNFWNVISDVWVSSYLFDVSLLLLLFFMGLSFGSNREAITKMKRTGLKILIVPFLVASGTIVAGFLGGLIFQLDSVASMAATAGYGWYTLAGPLVGQIFGPEWGMLGFTVNFLRELFTIVTVSLLFKVDKYAPIASGGATTMDTTLPVIVRYCGSDALMTAFASGFTLSIIAPFSILAIASLR
jgi:uncharacterized membrane protein YbjE (DUF340 family)